MRETPPEGRISPAHEVRATGSSFQKIATDKIFNNMAGAANDSGQYINLSLSQGIDFANDDIVLASPTVRMAADNAAPLPSQMRLYNAPRIVYANLSQDRLWNSSYSNVLYNYNPYPNYPYGSGTMEYPGWADISNRISNSSGPLRVALKFSEPMNISSFTARLRFSDDSIQNITGNWSSTELIGDTWVSTTSFPNPIPPGLVRVEILGRKVDCGSGDDTTVQYLDLDGDGTSIPGTYDSSARFSIYTAAQGAGEFQNAADPDVPLGSIANSTNSPSIVCPDNTGAGISTAALTGPNYSRIWNFSASGDARVGIATGLAQATYTLTCENLAASSSTKTIFYSTASINNFSMSGTVPSGAAFGDSRSVADYEIGDVASTRLRLKVACVPGGFCSGPTTATACAMMKLYAGGTDGQCHAHLGGEIYGEILLMPQTASFVVKNETQTASDFNITVEASIYRFAAYERTISTTLPIGTMTSGGTLTSTVSVQEVHPTFSSSTAIASIESTIKTSAVQTWSCGAYNEMAAQQGLATAVGCTQLSGSELVYLRPGTMTFTVQGSTIPPAVDAATVKIYGWTGSSWTLSGISNQGAVVSTSNVIVATGSFTRSGFYAVLFSVTDGTAPTTSWSILGSSNGFAGMTLVSTSSYLIVSSTDPLVNNFHSGLATTYYRIDGLPGDAFSAYVTSFSFITGTHWVDHYAVDFAGNVSPIQRATMTVTGGSFTWLKGGDLTVDGNLLVGEAGSGAKVEVTAHTEYDYSLLVSSTDGRAMLAVDNANYASIGTAPATGRLTLAGVGQDTALALRSGNSTASVSGAQIAFGFDGSGDLRHRLYTQHGSAANWNKLVFALWTPASGSSSTLGGLPVLSLEGSTITASNALVHVMPAGVADKELVVSDGSGMGEGSVLRWDRWVPSAASLKKDIERLSRSDEDRAWDDVAALKPVTFRRKNGGLDAPLERGYVFEEIPASIKDGPTAASTDERLVNVELALKAAMRKIEAMKARIKKLKMRRP